MEQQGGKVRRKVLLNNVSESAQVKSAFSSCKAEGKWFAGRIMNRHETNQRSGQRVQQFHCRYKSRRPSSLPTDFRSFVGTDGKSVSVPPACEPVVKVVVVANPLPRG